MGMNDNNWLLACLLLPWGYWFCFFKYYVLATGLFPRQKKNLFMTEYI
jgi:hypothetical protein